VIVGENIGSVFLGDCLLKAPIPALLTKLSIHRSLLKAGDAPLIACLLRLSAFLTKVECSAIHHERILGSAVFARPRRARRQ
jgi:hypothetical protein